MKSSSHLKTRICTISAICILALFLTGCASFQPYDPTISRTHPVDQLSDISEIASAAKNSTLTFIKNDTGIQIPVRVYGKKSSCIPVLMIHGLQSHSGWFAQSANFINTLGLPVYQIDRRGSGMSTEPRGHSAGYDNMIADILTVAQYAMKQHGVDKVHLLGHCFGAIPGTAFAVRYPELLQSLILCTPALYTQTSVYFKEAVQIIESELTHDYKYIPIHIQAEQFTDSATYLHFIHNDKLALKQVTTSLYFQVPLARHYINKNSDKLTMPVFMGMAGRDTICDNEKDREFFNNIPSERKMSVTYKQAKHILEFSEDRDIFFTDLAAWFSTL